MYIDFSKIYNKMVGLIMLKIKMAFFYKQGKQYEHIPKNKNSEISSPLSYLFLLGMRR